VTAIPPSFADLLARPMGEVARVVLRHERRTSFRWVGLVELSLSLLVCVCALPILVVLFVLSGEVPMGEGGDDDPGFVERALRRLHSHHHDLALSFYGSGGEALADTRHTPRSQVEGEAILCALLRLARTQGVVVVELLAPAEIACVFYGGAPVLALPEGLEPQKDRARLDAAGFETELIDEGLRITQEGEPRSRFGAFLLLCLLLALLPIVLLTRGGREVLADVWADFKGLPAEEVVLTLGSTLRYERRRGGRVRDSREYPLSSLLAVRYGPELGYDREVSRREARLSLWEHDRGRPLPLKLGSGGWPLRNLLVAAAIEAQSEEAGVASAMRCPYCATQYELSAHARCPRCGAWAGDLMK